MSREEVRARVLEALGRIAPEAELDAIRDDLPLRDQLDIDSMDQLRLIVALHESLGVEIPEADYGKLRTLSACLDYLAAALGRPR